MKSRLVGATNKSRCRSDSAVDETLTNPTRWSQLSVLLCLSMNYPDAVGRAPVGMCLPRTGPGTGRGAFQAVTCPQANVIVTARTTRFADRAFCGPSGGWTTWKFPQFPTFAYTVCFRHK